MTKSLLVFDLDGTLVDTMGDYGDKAALLMEEHYGTDRVEARNLYFKTSGLPFEQQLKIIYPDQCNTDEVADKFEDWKDGYLQEITLPEDIEALFIQWRKSGYKIAISSNNLQIYVDRLAADWPVDAALGYRPAEQYGKGEAHFKTLEETFNLDRQKMLFTGDSPNDARIAGECRVDFTALLTEEFTPDDFKKYDADIILLDHLAELNSHLGLN